jgi:hypothetical protein
MPLVGFFSRMSLLAGLLLGAVLLLMRRWAVRLRERRGWDESAACPGRVEVDVLGRDAPGAAICAPLAACSWGNSSWVGETLGPRLPFWRVVSTVSEEVAVVVCGAPSIFNPVLSQSCAREFALRDVPSDSEPATELRPLQLWPRELANMAEPIEYKDEKDRRLFSAASTSGWGRGGRHASGSMSAFTGARLARVPSSVGVVSTSSTADPL